MATLINSEATNQQSQLGKNTTLRAHLCKQLVVPAPLIVVPHHVTTWW